MKDGFKIRGEVKYFQTEKGILMPESSKDINKKLIIPGTYVEDHNTTLDDLKFYLAHKIVDISTDQALNSLFTTQTPASEVGNDGIGWSTSETTALAGTMITTQNDGGDNNVAYVEFYGYADGSVTINSSLYLGFNLIVTTLLFTKYYASYTINQVVSANRRFHFYWKITLN